MAGRRARSLRSERVRQLMRREFISVEPDESVAEVRQIMRLARLRHLPVVHDGILVGLLTYRDLLEAISEGTGAVQLDESISVHAAMIASPHSIAPERPLADAAARLWRLRLGCLPVVEETPEGERVVGLVTETDLLRAAYDPLHRPARD